MKKLLRIIAIFFICVSITSFGYQDIILEGVNEARIQKGLKPLKMNKELNKVAIIKATDMAKEEKLSHNSKEYGLTFNIIKKRGIKYSAAAENIARWHDTPEFVVKRWLESDGHRKNILNSEYDETGIGKAQDKNGKNYWVQLFIKRKN